MNNFKKYILIFFAACVGLMSCVKEDMFTGDQDGLVSFKAVYGGPESKTILDGLTPMWTPEDKISIYDGKNNEFTNTLTSNAKTSEFYGKLEGQGFDRKSFIAAYPYNENYIFSFVSYYVGGIQILTEQTVVQGSYDPNSAPAVAFADTTILSFNNAYSLMKFAIVSDGVTEVTVVGNGGETLAGVMNVAKADPLRITVTKPETAVTLKGDFKKGATYYMAVVPTTLKNGFTVTLKNSSGASVESMKYTMKANFDRSAVLNIGSLSLNPQESQLPDGGDNGNEGSGDNGNNDDVTPETNTVYMRPNANWKEAGARFAAYFFEGETNAWIDLTDADGDGTYECKVPEGYTNLIFTRMNPDASENNWDNKWNQSGDLTVPTNSSVCFVLKEGEWDGDALGYWTTYPPVIDEGGNDNPGTGDTPVTFEGKIYMRPNSEWKEAGARFTTYFFGNGEVWVDMTDADGDGTYECGVPSGFDSVIFVRMNPSTSENVWDNKWNQSSDLSVPTGNAICYVLNAGQWDGDGLGYWTTYPPVVDNGGSEDDGSEDDGSDNGNPGDNDEGNTGGSSSVRIYLSNAWGWPYIWCWDPSNNDKQIFDGASWPGTRYHGEENGYYYWNVPESYIGKTVSLLAVKEDQSEQSSDFVGVTLSKDVYFYLEWTSEAGVFLVQEKR